MSSIIKIIKSFSDLFPYVGKIIKFVPMLREGILFLGSIFKKDDEDESEQIQEMVIGLRKLRSKIPEEREYAKGKIKEVLEKKQVL